MIKNYLIVTFRNLFRNKAFSVINVVGLAFGISCSLLTLLWVLDELSMDAFHANRERLYRVMENQAYTDGKTLTTNSTPGPMAPVIKEKFPEIEFASRMTWGERKLFQEKKEGFFEEGRFVDQDFLQMFSFPLQSGDVNTALKDMHSIVISEKMATKFFGKEEAIGKVLVMDAGESFKVTGVLAPLPPTSSLKFDFLLPFSWYFEKNKQWLDRWDNNNVRTFIQLKQNTDVTLFSSKLEREIDHHVDGDNNISLFIQKYKDAYLHSEFVDGQLVGGRIESVRIFFIVAVLVLLIASINFMNLTTAQSAKRAKEVGLRKTIGAIQSQLAFQFLSESMIMVFLSSAVAVVLAFLLLPLFNEIAGKELSFNLLTTKSILLLLSVVLFTGLISGSYPALYISGFQPARVLKGQLRSGSGAARFRKVLVVVQFTLSIVLIISTLVVYRQMDFVQNKDIGLDRNNLIYLYMNGDMSKHADAIREELMKEPAVEVASLSSANPIDFGNSTSNLTWEGKDPNDKILFSNFSVDYNFIESMKMKLMGGRSFKQEIATDTVNFIINEAAQEAMGFDNAVDQPLTLWNDRKGKVIGVVQNFHFQSIHTKVEPLFMMYEPDFYSVIFVRFKEGQRTAALQALEKINKHYAAAYPFEFKQLSEDWDDLYKSEDRFGKLFNYFSFLSILISCLGLFGLSAFSAEQKTKELGVRKVMGASVSGLVQLMAKEFAWLVLLAMLIGCSIGWYVMDWWLGTYAYHVEVGIVTIFMAALICFVVSMATVSYHAAKAAMIDPVRSLRYE
ncbi:MAG: ABC transporter permease [Bacteroidetes bacterium]|nr:ABC transporter permease [Bacteroidota bacterium]